MVQSDVVCVATFTNPIWAEASCESVLGAIAEGICQHELCEKQGRSMLIFPVDSVRTGTVDIVD